MQVVSITCVHAYKMITVKVMLMMMMTAVGMMTMVMMKGDG